MVNDEVLVEKPLLSHQTPSSFFYMAFVIFLTRASLQSHHNSVIWFYLLGSICSSTCCRTTKLCQQHGRYINKDTVGFIDALWADCCQLVMHFYTTYTILHGTILTQELCKQKPDKECDCGASGTCVWVLWLREAARCHMLVLTHSPCTLGLSHNIKCFYPSSTQKHSTLPVN